MCVYTIYIFNYIKQPLYYKIKRTVFPVYCVPSIITLYEGIEMYSSINDLIIEIIITKEFLIIKL